MLGIEPQYKLQNISVVPARMSNIIDNIDIYYKNILPIFTSPSSDIVSIDNIHIWEQNKIIPIIPINIDFNTKLELIKKDKWVAISFQELTEIANNFWTYFPDGFTYIINIVIDDICGNINQLIPEITKCKNLANIQLSKLNIMVSGIVNYETLIDIENYNEQWFKKILKNNKVVNYKLIDYIRVGINKNHINYNYIDYALGSLLDNINNLHLSTPLIIAEGEINTYKDIITALALGANYVMVDDMFISLFESAAKFVNKKVYNDPIFKLLYLNNIANEVSKQEFIKKSKTPIFKIQDNSNHIQCTQTINQWTTEFETILKNAIMYSGKISLTDFIGNVDCIVIH